MLEHWLHLPLFLFLLYLLWKQAPGAVVLWSSALAVKLLSGVLLGMLYLHFLGRGDTWLYHDRAEELADLARGDMAAYGKFLLFNQTEGFSVVYKDYSNSFFFLKILSLLHLLTGNSYWWSGAYLSLFSFWGSWSLVKQIRRVYPAYGGAAAAAFLFFPSTVFWLSGVTKDSVLMGSLCLVVAYAMQLMVAHSLREKLAAFLPLLVAAYLFWKIKFFLAAVLLVLLTAYLCTKALSRRVSALSFKGRQVGVWLGFLVGLAFLASFAHPTFTVDFFLRHILFNYQKLLAKTDLSLPHLSFPELAPTLGSVLLHSPSAVAQMLLRPFVWEPAPLFYRLMGIENLLLLLLLALFLGERMRQKSLPVLPSFLGVLLVFFLIGAVLVTLPTPNLGSLHRYRAPLLPFLLLPLLAGGPWPRWWRARRGSTR